MSKTFSYLRTSIKNLRLETFVIILPCVDIEVKKDGSGVLELGQG